MNRMTKSELRIIYKEKRQKLSLADIEKYNDLILINFQKIRLPPLYCIHTYLASLRLVEADTTNIVRYLQFKNPDIKIAVPKIDALSGNIHHYYLNENIQLVPNAFGIDEPAAGEIIPVDEIDIVLIPLLTFDKKGYRVGYGKGFYDKFLSECRPDVIRVGLSFFDPVEAIDDVNDYDIPLNYCVTSKQLIHFY